MKIYQSNFNEKKINYHDKKIINKLYINIHKKTNKIKEAVVVLMANFDYNLSLSLLQ